MLDHVNTNKWSYRVVIEDKETLLGLKKFSLQSPRRRSFLNEWLFHALLKYEGLPFLRYDLVELYINGKYKGIYALEEHFDKYLIDNNKFGHLITIDCISHNEKMIWNCIDDLEGPKTRYELLKPWEEKQEIGLISYLQYKR